MQARRDSSYTETLISKYEYWILPFWGVFAAIMLYLISRGVSLSYNIRYNDAVTLFSQQLDALGLSPEAYAWYFLSLDFFLVGVCMVVGLYLILVSRNNQLAILVAFWLIAWVSTWIAPYVQVTKLYFLPTLIIDVIGNVLYATLLLTFPSGRLQAKWVHWWIVPVGVFTTLVITPYNSWIEFNGATTTLFDFILYFVSAGAIGLQVLRYRYHSNVIERQQSKWVFAGFLISYIIPIIYVITDLVLTPFLIENPSLRLAYRFFTNAFLITLPFSLIPISLLIAITKSRLWQIDLLINKVAVSAFVTMTLLALFAVGVTVFQTFIGNTIFSTASMLIIVILLYSPLRGQIQNLLDRRILGFRFNLNELKRAEIPREITKAGALSGQIIKGYEVLNVIARGGMGEIYQGVSSNQPIAIKTVLPTIAQDPIALKRFEQEVAAGKILKHPNVIDIYESGEEDGTPYIVMDYIPGKDLKTTMASQALDIPRALAIFEDIANALEYTHAQGLIHRDVKPENVIIREDGTAILIDFGLVKFANTDKETSGEGAIGTIDYMSPEQIREGIAIDKRADVYAMGVLLFEMLTGTCPFTGDVGQILYAHLAQPPPDPCDYNSDIPIHICLAVLRALSKDPDDRYASMSAFMDIVLEPEYAETA